MGLRGSMGRAFRRVRCDSDRLANSMVHDGIPYEPGTVICRERCARVSASQRKPRVIGKRHPMIRKGHMLSIGRGTILQPTFPR
jgi:hypothetical protein